MEFEEVLKVEYEQQYEQYRWIGTQQTLVFTFYAAIVAATFALMRVSDEGPFLQKIQPWFPWVLIFLGIIGILISIALIYSRAMQFRTAIYLQELIVQITEESKSKPSAIPAIIFRKLPSTGGRFRPKDTAVISISLALVFGISLILVPITIWLGAESGVEHWEVAVYWLLPAVVFSLLGVLRFLPWLLDKQTKKARKDHISAKAVKDWVNCLRSDLGLKCN